MALDREQVGLLFKLKADTSDATQSLTQFKGTLNNSIATMRSGIDDASRSILSNTGSMGSSIADLSAGLTGWAATAGVAFAAVAAGMVKLSLATAEYAGQIKDLSDKTNLTTDTLQSLRLAATLSGQSFESISQTAVIFQRRMEEARTKGGELAETFKALGVNLSGPVDEAFRNTLEKLSGFKDSAEKTALTVDLFGRSGADLLPVIKQLDGQFSNLENRARELGIVLDKDAIEKADAFGDQLDILKLQVGGVANQIGSILIPALSNMVTGLSNAITFTKQAADETRTFEQRLLDAAKAAAIYLSYLNPLSGHITRMSLQPGGAGTPQNEFESFFEHEANKPRPTKTGGGGAGRTPREQAVRLPIQDFDRMTAQYFERLTKLEEDSLKKLDQARERSAATQEAILKEIEQREIDSIKAQVDQRVITEEEGAARVAAVRVAAFARTEDALKAQLDQQTTELAAAQAEATANQYNLTLGPVLAAKAAQLDAERTLTVQKLTQLQEERASIELEGNRRIDEAREQDTQNLYRQIEQKRRAYQAMLLLFAGKLVEQGFSQQTSEAIVEQQRTLGRQLTLWEQIRLEATLTANHLQQTIPAIGATFIDMKNAVADSLGAIIASFVAGKSSLRQAAAELFKAALAPLKEYLMKKARAHFAMGFAEIAMMNYGGAAKHFFAGAALSAAAGLIDVGAAAIAGGGGASQGNIGPSGGQDTRNQGNRIIEQGGPLRGSQQPQIIIIRAETEPGVVVRKIVDDYRSNGASRQVLRRDMLGEG